MNYIESNLLLSNKFNHYFCIAHKNNSVRPHKYFSVKIRMNYIESNLLLAKSEEMSTNFPR